MHACMHVRLPMVLLQSVWKGGCTRRHELHQLASQTASWRACSLLGVAIAMHAYACICICMHACMHACMHPCMHPSMHPFMHAACMHACMHAYICMHAYACMHLTDPQLLDNPPNTRQTPKYQENPHIPGKPQITRVNSRGPGPGPPKLELSESTLHACMHACMHACVHACMHMHAYACICMHMNHFTSQDVPRQVLPGLLSYVLKHVLCPFLGFWT